MREILFRGKSVNSGEWVCGGYFKTDNEHYIITNTDDIVIFSLWDYAEFIIPETVSEFCGLTDKNGKKIFEGDIIKVITIDTNTERLAVVGFGKFIDENNGDEYIGFYVEFDGIKITITQLEMEEVKDRFEVIGNVFDNPELVEGV